MSVLKAFVFLLCSFIALEGQSVDHPEDAKQTIGHEKDSYVLIIHKQAIMRGWDFSIRALALSYRKKNHLQDLVFFSSGNSCFVTMDGKAMEQLQRMQKVQEALGTEEEKVGGSDLNLARELSQKQTRLSIERDKVVWQIFDDLEQKKELIVVGPNCPHKL